MTRVVFGSCAKCCEAVYIGGAIAEIHRCPSTDDATTAKRPHGETEPLTSAEISALRGIAECDPGCSGNCTVSLPSRQFLRVIATIDIANAARIAAESDLLTEKERNVNERSRIAAALDVAIGETEVEAASRLHAKIEELEEQVESGFRSLDQNWVSHQQLITMRNERDRWKADAREWSLALQSLTPGGSEYVDDPARCVEAAREGREFWRRAAIKLKRHFAGAEAQLRAAVAAIKTTPAFTASSHSAVCRDRLADIIAIMQSPAPEEWELCQQTNSLEVTTLFEVERAAITRVKVRIDNNQPPNVTDLQIIIGAIEGDNAFRQSILEAQFGDFKRIIKEQALAIAAERLKCETIAASGERQIAELNFKIGSLHAAYQSNVNAREQIERKLRDLQGKFGLWDDASVAAHMEFVLRSPKINTELRDQIKELTRQLEASQVATKEAYRFGMKAVDSMANKRDIAFLTRKLETARMTATLALDVLTEGTQRAEGGKFTYTATVRDSWLRLRRAELAAIDADAPEAQATEPVAEPRKCAECGALGKLYEQPAVSRWVHANREDGRHHDFKSELIGTPAPKPIERLIPADAPVGTDGRVKTYAEFEREHESPIGDTEAFRGSDYDGTSPDNAFMQPIPLTDELLREAAEFHGITAQPPTTDCVARAFVKDGIVRPVEAIGADPAETQEERS